MSLDVFWTGLDYAVRDREAKTFLSRHQTRDEANTRLEEISMEAMTRTCKREGCQEEAVARLGPYGGLCQAHKDEARATLSAVHTGKPKKTVIETVASTNGSTPSLTHRVSELLTAARALEEARDAYQAACVTYNDVLAKLERAEA